MVIKRDFILAATMLVIGIIAYLCMKFLPENGNEVKVYVDGKETATYSLKDDGIYSINGKNGNNTLVIKGGEAMMKDADCPDRLCVKQGSISKNGESIVCLPHKVIVTVTGGDGADYDIR